MKKILGGFAGFLVGYAAWLIVKYATLLTGPFVLGPMGISGPEAAKNLESIAEILGFITFVVVLQKIYKSITAKREKTMSIEAHSDVKES